MYGALDISTSGMIAQRTRLNVIAANIANAGSIANDRGEADPYRRRLALLAPGASNRPGSQSGESLGVRVSEIALDQSPFRKVFDPNHPLAAKETNPANDQVEGYVNHPNIDTTIEWLNAMEASRAYEANVMVAEASKSMMASALGLIA